MKKKSLIISFIIAISAISIIFYSCSKDDELLTEQQEIEIKSDYQLTAELKTGITQENSLLVFKSKKQFENITNLLEAETKKWIDEYISNLGNVSEEELNQKMEDDNFNPFIVYEAFEKYHSFKTLRALLKEKEDKWLEESTELDAESDPSLYPLSERCCNIANIEGEYMIDNNIYRVENDGLVYEIKNADFTALESIRSGKYDIFGKNKNSNIIIHREEVRSMSEEGTKASCKAYVRHTKTYNYANKKKMYCILDLDWDGWGSAAKAKVKCYKKVKRWGKWKWKRHWTSMGASLCVKARDINCKVKTSIGNNGLICNSKSRNWAYYVSTHVYASGAGMRVKPGEHGGVYSKKGYNDFSISW